MDLLKLVAVFCIIILVMWMKKPLLIAVLAATLGTIILYSLPPETTYAAVVLKRCHQLDYHRGPSGFLFHHLSPTNAGEAEKPE